MMASRSRRLLLYAGSALAVYLLGAVPQYRKTRQCRSDVEAQRRQMAVLQSRLEVAELRHRIGLVYLEVNRKNYGLAREHAGGFFVRAQQLAAQTADAGLKAVLEAALERRDAITAGLAKAEGGAREEIENLFGRLHQDSAARP